VVGTLVLVEVERLPRGERRRKPRVLWLWWHGPEGEAPNLDLIWRSYVRRFDLEHTFRFLKQSMGWTTPRVRHPEQADRWTWLVVGAFTQLRLAPPACMVAVGTKCPGTTWLKVIDRIAGSCSGRVEEAEIHDDDPRQT